MRSRAWFGRPRRQRPLTLVVAGGLLASLAAVAAVGADMASATGEALPATTGEATEVEVEDVPGGPAVAPDPEAVDEVADVAVGPATPRFAHVEGIDLHLPGDELVVLGFHESATRQALALAPVGTVVDHQNTTKFDPPPSAPDGVDYLVLSSRGRPMPATSAADLVLPDGVAVRSPVDGEVTDVREYFLYGKYLDHRVEIRPDAAPHLRVVMIHVDGAAVAVGDRVVAGETIVSPQVRRFAFASHIDRYTEPHRHGHVHLEVKPADATRPGDDLDLEVDADDAAADAAAP